MIYAIEAAGSGFVKFGVTARSDIESRVKSMQVGCPYVLKVRATANWLDKEERGIHRFLKSSRHRGEWFRLCEDSELVIECMLNQKVATFHALIVSRTPARLRKAMEFGLSV